MNSVQVLLVEDNAGDALLTRQALAGCPLRVNLTIARHGEQALHILSDGDYKPDLIILDLNIPKIPGHVVLERYPTKSAPWVCANMYGNPPIWTHSRPWCTVWSKNGSCTPPLTRAGEVLGESTHAPWVNPRSAAGFQAFVRL
jgi:hypothetical protein